MILCGKLYAQPTGSEDRMYWVQTLTKIADPVLVNLSQGTLKGICRLSHCLMNLYVEVFPIWKR